MPLTARQIANDLLAHTSNRLSASTPFTGAADSPELLPVGMEDYLVNTLNLAVEEMHKERPGLFRETIGVVFEEPKQGTVSVTQGSNSLYLGTMEEPAANGCTILIEGDSIYNEIRPSGSELGDFLLLHNFGGTTGERNATIWGDSAIPGVAYRKILGGILLADRRPLAIVNNRVDWLRFKGYGLGDYGTGNVQMTDRERFAGTPEAIWVETSFDGDDLETRIRCAPLPSAQFAVELEVQTMPTEVSAADLNADAAFYFSIPGQQAYRIFRALALYHWSGSPWFAAKESVQKRIDDGYFAALQALKSWQAHGEAGACLEISGY